MKCVYVAADPIEAEIVRGLLQAEHIACEVFGAALWSARGEIAADSYPRVMLRDDRDETLAQEILQIYRRREPADADWGCPCGERVPGNFALCWSCGQPSVS